MTSGAGLAEWARSWGSDVFRPGLLADDSVHVLACRSDGGIVAGAVASVAAAVVGISNVFAVAGVDESTWAGVLRQVELLLPGIPVVGYEHGTDLTIAEQSGLRRTGPLRIWISDG